MSLVERLGTSWNIVIDHVGLWEGGGGRVTPPPTFPFGNTTMLYKFNYSSRIKF